MASGCVEEIGSPGDGLQNVDADGQANDHAHRDEDVGGDPAAGWRDVEGNAAGGAEPALGCDGVATVSADVTAPPGGDGAGHGEQDSPGDQEDPARKETQGETDEPGHNDQPTSI